MSETKYFLIQNRYVIDSETHIGYGIGYRGYDQTILFEDVSFDIEKISMLIELCNTISLSPIHFAEVIDDFLTDFA